MPIDLSTTSHLRFTRQDETLLVTPHGPHSARIRCFRNADPGLPPWDLLPPPSPPTPATVTHSKDRSTLTNGALTISLSPQGHLSFSRNGQTLLEEPAVRARELRGLRGADGYSIEQRFQAYDDERLFGLGQYQHGLLNQKGAVLDLEQLNTQVTIPVLLSSRKYLLFWNNPALGRVELGRTMTRWTSENAQQIDYFLTTAPDYAGLLKHYTAVTGRAPMLPEWAAGFWQSKLRYQTQDELLSVAREFKRRGLPLSVIVCDFFHWTKMGDFKFDPKCWPDPAAMVKELEQMGTKLLVSVWPTVNPTSENAAEMKDKGYLVRTDTGVDATHSFTDADTPGDFTPVYLHHYDPTHPDARAYVLDKVTKNYLSHGIDLFWLDACEPEMPPGAIHNTRYHLGPGTRVQNLYPLCNAQAFHEGLTHAGVKDVLTLCRSAWAGSQRYGAAVWSGDIPSTWDSLRRQIPAGLNIALSGIAWWTTDIGGFYGGDPADPAYQQLLIRWFQYGVFCPLFRLHGVRLPNVLKSGGPNEPWSYDDSAYQIISSLIHLRTRLKPYLLAQMRTAHETGLPPMRPLFLDFPNDPRTLDIDDSFLLGPDLLIAPITTPDTTHRQVYLPQGTWLRAGPPSTNTSPIQGPTTLEVQANLNEYIAFTRQGAAVSNAFAH
jgi:alpha-D-xyloside xylohydrolase